MPASPAAGLQRRHVLGAALAGGLGAWTTASALPLPQLIAQAKRSVVVVGSFGLMDNPRFGFRATGFVVGEGLHVITNAHVVPPDEPGRIDRSIAVQVWQDGSWRMRSARLLGRDLRNDLALLEIDGPAVPALKLAAGPEAPEGTGIALMGFPIGQALGWAHVTHRGIVSAWTGIATPASDPAGLNPRAVRQLREGNFRIMQLDAIAYPGNSGGPVLDIETGEVIGVVQGGTVKGTKEAALSAPTGITFAVPAGAAAALLAEFRR